MRILLLVTVACLLAVEARRVQIRPRVSEPQVYYEEEEEEAQSAEDDYATAVYQPRTRALVSPRSKDLHASKPPPVQTIRNYNKVNDDGSFTFGYEAADGSFKEETRGTDCVVRGKYGYIDPDGNKREFTYVSGNPCDPNAPKEDEDDLAEKQEEDDLSGPANYPSIRPVPRPTSRPAYHHPATTRAPTTIFQTEYQLDDDASQELDDDVNTKSHLRPTAFRRPQPTYVQVSPVPSTTPLYETTPAPQLYRLASTAQYQTTPSPRTQATVATTVYQPVETSTRRAVTPARHQARPQSVAITPRPHVAQVAAQYVSPSSTQRPSTLSYAATRAPSASQLDFAAELERYVNSINVASNAKLVPAKAKLVPATQAPVAAEPIYQSELIYDPSSAQQSLIGLPQQPLYKQPQAPQAPQQVLYKKQQAELLQQSQQLYAQQQRRQQQQQQQQQQQHQQQPQRLQLLETSRVEPQQFYYVAPARSHTPGNAALAAGQIDQFLQSGSRNY
ncbi:putative mediator of RNA polymerase II transcription subunit 12 isoform X2 [Prorops nasuta]|uniref:putative mediator of RNA polymerase II transcription subunit 12 isoform X2 n=1 Tax=Prorops nasuta TaxID=863751 RepID=UPI0034CFAD26